MFSQLLRIRLYSTHLSGCFEYIQIRELTIFIPTYFLPFAICFGLIKHKSI